MGGNRVLGFISRLNNLSPPLCPTPFPPYELTGGGVGHCRSCSPRRGGREAGEKGAERGFFTFFSKSNASGIHLRL